VLGLFRLKTYISYFTTILILFSFPVILAIERANIDVLIFILMVFLAYFKNRTVNLIILVLVTISKFYPIALAIIFFFEKNLKKIFINFLIFLVIISLIFFIQSEQMLKIFANKGQVLAFGIYDFSLIGTVNFFKNYNIFIFVLLLVVPSIIFLIKIIKYSLKEEVLNKLNYNFFEDRLYIFSSVIILLCYFSFSNYVYREIFFIGLVPWILKIKMLNNKDQKFFSFYYYFLMFKFFISVPITYIYMNNIIKNINPLLSIFKYTLDLYLISFIVAIILVFFIRLLNFSKSKVNLNDKI
jgi:hypothetical protein